jgi:hypothetical protein
MTRADLVFARRSTLSTMPRIPTFPTHYDDLKHITIADLKRWNYLEPGTRRGGVITWKQKETTTASISILVNINQDGNYIDLDYMANGDPIKYRISLTSLPSNLGNGIVWYFVCPETGKRCRKLYLIGTRFLHREAFEGGMYSGQTQSKRWRHFDALIRFLNADEPFNRKYAKKYYKGRPTKSYLRLLRRCVRVNDMLASSPLFE